MFASGLIRPIRSHPKVSRYLTQCSFPGHFPMTGNRTLGARTYLGCPAHHSSCYSAMECNLAWHHKLAILPGNTGWTFYISFGDVTINTLQCSIASPSLFWNSSILGFSGVPSTTTTTTSLSLKSRTLVHFQYI